MCNAVAASIRISFPSTVFALTAAAAVTGVVVPVNAASLSAEQRAIVEKYGISEADQKKLFGKTTADVQPGVATFEKQDALAESAAPAFLAGTYVFSGVDTYKSIGDRLTNINGGTGSLTGSLGAVVGFNSGFTLTESNFGIQGGASFGAYDFKGRIRLVPDSTTPETHAYYTAGVYKRGDMSDGGGSLADRLSAGVVVDVFRAKRWGINANDIHLSQIRGTVGFALNKSTEIGVWGTYSLNTDMAAVTVAGAPGVRREIRAMNQANVYVKHNFDFGGDITAYVGMFDNASIGNWQVGMTGRVPLDTNWAAYGGANYVLPNSATGPTGSGEEQFSLSLGLAYHFGANAASSSVTGNRQLPLLDVASSRTFLITD